MISTAMISSRTATMISSRTRDSHRPPRRPLKIRPGADAPAQERCMVADPTGTPLNVRTVPNRKIVSTLRNGFTIDIIQATTNSGRVWVYVRRADSNVPLGWVFRDYLDCDQQATRTAQDHCMVADPTGTPLNVRTAPNGRIVSTLRNGFTVTIIESASNEGKAWAYVRRADNDIPLGWVFRDYLNCDQQAIHRQQPPSADTQSSLGPSSRIIVQLKSDGGIFVVPVEINGASEVPSDVFIIRSLKVGNYVVENVRASIASPKATLLLGQSFLRHFKSWSIDNTKHALVLE
jgi:hypothetical protein